MTADMFPHDDRDVQPGNAMPAALSAVMLLVTPEMAKAWLEHNSTNRKLRWNQVESYAADMRAGLWPFAGEAIKFSTDGRLLDGQHRLRAIVLTGMSMQMLVVRGLADEAQKVMDTGVKRTAADALKMERGSHESMAAAGARLALKLRVGAGDRRSRPVISNAQIIQWIDDNPAFRAALPLAAAHVKRIPVESGVMALVAWQLRELDAEAARDFLSQVALPDGIAADDPRAALSRRLTQLRSNRVRESPAFYLDLVYQAWNRWRLGRPAKAFRVMRSERGHVQVTQPL